MAHLQKMGLDQQGVEVNQDLFPLHNPDPNDPPLKCFPIRAALGQDD